MNGALACGQKWLGAKKGMFWFCMEYTLWSRSDLINGGFKA